MRSPQFANKLLKRGQMYPEIHTTGIKLQAKEETPAVNLQCV